MEQLLQFLSSVHPLSEGLVDYLATHIKVRDIERKEMLLKAGHTSRYIYFVASGLLRCFYLKGDAEVSAWFMKEGDVIVSIESFYTQQPSRESIQALEDSRLLYIEYNELYHCYRYFPEFNFTGRELTQKYYVLWAQQLHALKMQTPVERYQWLLTHHNELILRVPAKFLASYLGIGEVTLSRIKNKYRFLNQ